MMKILQLIESAATGAGRHVLALTEGLAERGNEIHVLYSPLREDELFRDGLRAMEHQGNVHAVPMAIKRNPHPDDMLLVRKLRQYIVDHGPFDIIHCHSTKAGWVGRWAANRTGVPCIYTPHGFFHADPSRPAWIRRWAAALEGSLGKMSRVVVVSRTEYEDAVRQGIPAEKLTLVPNGVPLPAMADRMEREGIRRAWGVGENEFCVGFVGRFTPVKSPQTALAACAALRSAGLPFKLVMIGEGPLEGALREQAAELGLSDAVVWAGVVDARPLYCAMDAFLLSSVSEGHPLVMLEAMAAGMPVVVTAVGGVEDSVKPGVTGLVAPVGDGEALGRHLLTLIRDPELRARMRRAAKEGAQEFSVERMVERIEELYVRAIREQQAAHAAVSRSTASTS